MVDVRHLVCPHCATTNRVPANKSSLKARCGGCHRPLFDGHSAAVDAARFEKHWVAEVTPHNSGRAFERHQHIACTAAEIEDFRIGTRENRGDALHCPRAPAFVQIEGKQVIQQVIAAGNTAEHSLHPAGFLNFGLIQFAASQRKTASIDSSTTRSSTPDTTVTSPILTGKTK